MLAGPALAQLIHTLFRVYYLLLIVRCVMSWMRPPSYRSPWLPVWNFVYACTEPLLKPIRQGLSRMIPGSPLDFSPFVLIVLLSVVEGVIIKLLVTAI